MFRITWLGLLLGAATCDAGPGGANNTVTTPTEPGTPTLNGTLDCGDDIPTPAPGQYGNPVCVVEELTCGDVVQGSNTNGSTLYDKTYWEDAQELGALATEDADVLDGPEVVYAIVGHPTGTEVVVTVSSCVQLWPSWRKHGDISQDWCDIDSTFEEAGHFTGTWQDKSYTLLNRSANGVYDWEIIIDSWKGQTGNFTISVECFN